MEVKPDPDFPYELIPGGRDYPWRTRKFPEHFYRYQDRVIWGLTASVLAHFIDLLKD